MDNNDNLNSLPDENGESSPEATYESPQADNPPNEEEPLPEAPDFENLEDDTQEKKKKRKPWFSDPVERLEAFNDEFGEDRTEKRIGFLRRTAKEVRRYNVALRILSAALGFMLLLTIILYIIAALYMKTGSFTVRVDKVDMTKYGLTLSESRDMFYSTSHLNAEIEKSITNIAEDWLPDNLGMIDGDHSGANYIAYTFYLQNGGDVEVSYEYSVIMTNVTNALDEAIRLRLYVNDVPTNYAKTRSDGKGAEPGTTEFYSSTLMMKDRKDGFKPGDVTKFTVVLWIEGNDPDCVDWLIGGEMKVEMDMSIVH